MLWHQRFILNGVIPERRSQRVRPLAGPMTGSVEANPESSHHRAGLLDSGFSTLGLRLLSRPGM